MRLFTFITYLTQHIPDKHFRVVRGYGLFSNRLKGELLPKARSLLNQSRMEKNNDFPSWRERQIENSGNDPLKCEKCSNEMKLKYVCYLTDEYWITKLQLNVNDVIPQKQFQIIEDSG